MATKKLDTPKKATKKKTKKATKKKAVTKKTTAGKTFPKAQARHKTFVEEYLKDFNGTRAYGVIYPNANYNTARAESSKYLRKPDVKAYLDKRLEERKQECRVDQEYIRRKIMLILESDYVGTTQYLTKEEIDQLDPEVRKLIQGYDLNKNNKTYRDGTYEESESYKVKFMSKDGALERLSKHLDFYAADNSKNVNLNVKSFTDALKGIDIEDEDE